MQRKRLFLMTCSFLLTVIQVGSLRPINAATVPPLIIELDRDLWAWLGPTQPLKRLTNYEGNRYPVYSPDLKYIAYSSIPQGVKDDLNKNGAYGGGSMPYNIWILDVQSGKATQVTNGGGGYNYSTLRTSPVWYSDSKYIAWTEVEGGNASNFHNYTEALLTYNVETRQQRTVVSEIPQFTYGGIEYPGDFSWSDYGFTLISSIGNTDATSAENSVYIFNPLGTLISRTLLQPGFNPYARWEKYQNKWYVLAVSDDSDDDTERRTSFLIDPDTHQKLPTETIPTLWERQYLCNAHAIDGICAHQSNDGKWSLSIPGQDDLPLPTSAFAISPDGQSAAYQGKNDCLFIYHASEIVQVDLTRGKPAAESTECYNTVYVGGFTWGPLIGVARK